MAAEAPMLDTIRAFPTPEHIAFEYRLAGPVARAAAWVIDALIRGGIFLAIAIPLLLIGMDRTQGLMLIIIFIIDWLSGGISEWLWKGQTPGKRALGIQVIGVDGLPAGFGACMLRNVLRWADGFPYVGLMPTFGFGLAALTVSGRFQRLGDIAAGTLVIYVERRLPPRQAQPKDPAAAVLAERLPPDIITALDGQAVRAIASFVARRRQYHPRRRQEMAEHLAGPIRRRFAVPADVDADTLLVACHMVLFPEVQKAYQRSGATAAQVLQQRRGDWHVLESILTHDRMAPQGPEQALALDRLYRSTCTDLALAEAHNLPGPHQVYLHALVAQAHLRFYRRLDVSWRAWWQTFLVDVPGRLYGDTSIRIAGCGFFGLFFGCALVTYWNPSLAVSFCGESALLSLVESFSQAPQGRSTIDGSNMGGFYIFNNVGIALSCFASGIFIGVGSLVWLAFNAIYLGCNFGWMAAQGSSESAHFFEFVRAHGPFELTGIALAGAAGLRLGSGFVVRQGRPLMESLVRSSAQAAPIVAVAAVLVALAAPIEAWISPSGLPIMHKTFIMAVSLVFLLLYFGVLGRRGHAVIRAADLNRERSV